MKIYNFSHVKIHFVHICEGSYQIVYQFAIENYNKYWYFDKNIAYSADYLVELIKSLPYSDEEKKKYYLDLVKAMDVDGRFEEEYSYIKDFENKILILEIYKEYNEQKFIRNGGNKDELFK